MTGTIVNLDFGKYLVYHQEQIYSCHIRKTDKLLIKPVVGDHVDFDASLSMITGIHPRQTFIKRPRVSNLTDIIIVTSLVEPQYSFFLLAKFISFGRYYNLNITNIITKIDQAKITDHQKDWNYLEQHGFKTLFFDKHHPDQQALLTLIGPNKVVAFAGQTGVGKSTIINALNPLFSRQIGSYSEALGRGKHQTKEVVLLPWFGGFIADTPGFSSLELPMLQNELAKVYPGFENQFSKCKFFNCTHQHEPGCQILQDVKSGKIPLEIYQDYVKMLHQLPEQKEY